MAEPSDPTPTPESEAAKGLDRIATTEEHAEAIRQQPAPRFWRQSQLREAKVWLAFVTYGVRQPTQAEVQQHAARMESKNFTNISDLQAIVPWVFAFKGSGDEPPASVQISRIYGDAELTSEGLSDTLLNAGETMDLLVARIEKSGTGDKSPLKFVTDDDFYSRVVAWAEDALGTDGQGGITVGGKPVAEHPRWTGSEPSNSAQTVTTAVKDDEPF